ncbi:MAG: aminopeptidase P family protein [Vicinamibacterales bacterium]|nr:aminopeptidase P family protein [Vicinamibacterales bacterium]
MPTTRPLRSLLVLAVVALVALAGTDPAARQVAPAQTPLNWEMARAGDIERILPLRERARVQNEILEWRLDNILPAIMRREGLEMWLVVTFEYAEDPVYMTLVSQPMFSARRLSILLFHDSKDGFRKLTANWHGASTSGPMYKNIFTDRSKGANHQFTVVADYIRQHDPKTIGINYAPHFDYHDEFAHGNGLSAFHKAKLEQALDRKYVDRLVSAEQVAMGWYETRSPRELSLYRHLAGIGHDLIAEFFSNRVITPDVTTADDVRWWIRDRINGLGLDTWFHPSIDITRSPADRKRYGEGDRVIRRGDLLHCDVGITYLGLNTDMQHNAYVLRLGETEAPAGLRELLRKGNRLQEIHLAEMREGRTGNDILRSILERGRAEGLRPTVYTHPVGPYGHGSGTVIGMSEKQEFVPGTGEHPLHADTVYAIEFSVAADIPEWGNVEVSTGFEEQAVFTGGAARWVDGYPRVFYLIR